MTDPLARIAALLDAPPDPSDWQACLRYRGELERGGGVGRWTAGDEPIDRDEWIRRRRMEARNGQLPERGD